MDLTAPAIVCAVRAHGETAVIVRLLTAAEGMVAAYVAGGRGRQLRPVVIPGNTVMADLRSRSDTQLPWARLELLASRAPLLAEPLPAAAIGWATALAAAALPERQGYPALFDALTALLEAIAHAPSARGWLPGLVAYETLLLRDLGYGGGAAAPLHGDTADGLAALDRLGPLIARYALAERGGDVMAARAVLRERLSRIL